MKDDSVDLIVWLENWYSSHCDGEWEHGFGISIRNIDNPGWHVTIDLKGTPLAKISLEVKEFNYGDDENWYRVSTEDHKFIGFGGARNLGDIISEFRELSLRGAET